MLLLKKSGAKNKEGPKSNVSELKAFPDQKNNYIIDGQSGGTAKL